MAKAPTPFTMSIEPVEGKVYQYGFHLGSDEKYAREIAEERFASLNKHGCPTRSVALMKGSVIVDVLDAMGWSSRQGWRE